MCIDGRLVQNPTAGYFVLLMKGTIGPTDIFVLTFLRTVYVTALMMLFSLAELFLEHLF
jgi:hypothetical protein